MPFVIREILLVSSPYDGFILEEDGPLNERLLSEYSEFNLILAPRLIHATDENSALALLNERRFDLVLVVPGSEGIDVNRFAERVKALLPRISIVVLNSDAQIRSLQMNYDPSLIQLAVTWSGDSKILFAIIKLIEDASNVDFDVRTGDVQIIVVVEDSPRYYSSFLALVYAEVMKQSHAVISEVLSGLHRNSRLRSRPKILLAKNFEQAVGYVERYPENIIGIISDCEFSQQGKVDASAGIHLYLKLNELGYHLPFLLQSSDKERAQDAKALNIHFAHKHSATLVSDIRSFLKTDLGFGDFVFRLPSGEEIGRAHSLYEMEELLGVMDLESIEYHARNNHFSMWFKARSMFILARIIKSKTIAELGGPSGVRNYLKDVLHRSRLGQMSGMVADFSQVVKDAGLIASFFRIGKGSIGGKGRGLAFTNHMQIEDLEKFNGLALKTPKSFALADGLYRNFIESHFANTQEFEVADDLEIKKRFLACPFTHNLRENLKAMLNILNGPIAVRSSSILEDSQSLSFAGIYTTYMLPNNDLSFDVRLEELENAIKCVYASVFCENSRKFMANTPFSVEDESMAVIIQEIVGRQRGTKFYPHISGVATSHNYYPIGNQKPEDGVAVVALGLGHTVLHGGRALRFSPGSPEILPQFSSASEYSIKTQRSFFAVDMTQTRVNFLTNKDSGIVEYSMEDSEKDGTFALVGSVYCLDDDLLKENFKLPGPRVVSFNNVLKWNSIPLAEALQELLQIMRKSFGCPVEIEFAVENGDPAILYVLQVRPFFQKFFVDEKVFLDIPKDKWICEVKNCLGHGQIKNIYDLVYVDENFAVSAVSDEKKNSERSGPDVQASKSVALDLGVITEKLQQSKTPFMLMGPGRWGTSDPELGIPVEWAQIAGATVIAEYPLAGKVAEPSQGTHFFHNITNLGIGYLTLSSVDWDWMKDQFVSDQKGAVVHLRFSNPLHIVMDGTTGQALVAYT